jgi:hypothetical protein
VQRLVPVKRVEEGVVSPGGNSHTCVYGTFGIREGSLNLGSCARPLQRELDAAVFVVSAGDGLAHRAVVPVAQRDRHLDRPGTSEVAREDKAHDRDKDDGHGKHKEDRTAIFDGFEQVLFGDIPNGFHM